MTTLVLLLLMAAGDGVQYVPAKEVSAAFNTMPPKPMITESNYAVMGLHRTAAGQAEVHDKDTDIFYVIEGSATFVTGGKVIGGKTTDPGETRGTGIEGGETHRLSKGDVITIPKGVPHRFTKVDGSIIYFVVKVK
jgi:quercetin dioxygenase-like cupin family protein